MTIMARHEITHDDIIPMEDYEAQRAQRRRDIVEMKKNRRLACGPDATFYFENFETMWQQIHEMLYIEKGGDEQIEDELRAYNPLVPKGRNLSATMMFEIDDPARRASVLGALGGVEETISIDFAGESVPADPESDVERTTEDGKTSSVHFLRFHFTDDQVAKFRDPGTRAVLSIAHANYGHMAVMPDAMREALAKDFD